MGEDECTEKRTGNEEEKETAKKVKKKEDRIRQDKREKERRKKERRRQGGLSRGQQVMHQVEDDGACAVLPPAFRSRA